MSNTFQPSKFRYLNDPPVSTRPFSIKLDSDKCIGCGVCIKQCPCQTMEMVPRNEASPKQIPACQHHCPAGTDIRRYLQGLSNGASLGDVWKIITETNPFPAITGRVCPHPCEGGCNREGVDDALNIHGIERAAGDFAIEKGLIFARPQKALKDKVAVIGSGPSGLACSYHLARMGYKVTVYEAESNPGGMLSYAIPRYRLPEKVVEAEIKRI
ncbi:MAG: FAD-dependent oxidoreductase, partial [Deltaproteobacteria bacterium]|nr:FAD-dependent oxidoreductase [Deltaproteobacteria bacterium]